MPAFEAMRKKIRFHNDKNMDMLKLSCTLPNLANNFLHKSTDAKLYQFFNSRREIETFWRKFEEMLLVVHPSYLHKKIMLMKLLFENQQTYANLLLGLMLANYAPTR